MQITSVYWTKSYLLNGMLRLHSSYMSSSSYQVKLILYPISYQIIGLTPFLADLILRPSVQLDKHDFVSFHPNLPQGTSPNKL